MLFARRTLCFQWCPMLMSSKAYVFPWVVFTLMPWSDSLLLLDRMFPAIREQCQWRRSASSGGRSSRGVDGADASVSELASWWGASDTCLSQSTGGSDVTMMDPEEDVLLVGQAKTGDESSEPSPLSHLQLASPVCELACSFPSGSITPVCASLVRSAKSSLLARARADEPEKRLKDNHPRNRHWPSARCPCEQEFYLRGASACCRCPSHTRQPATNVRLISMFPASVGLSRVSHGPYHMSRTECSAHEVCVDTRPERRSSVASFLYSRVCSSVWTFDSLSACRPSVVSCRRQRETRESTV